MPIDAGIYNALGVRPKSMMDYQDEYARQDLQKQAIQQNALALQQGQMKADEYGRGLREQETVRNALLGLGAGATDEQRINALKGTATPTGFSQADMLEKALAERQKTAAVTGKDNAQAAGYKLDQTVKAHAFHVQKLSTVNTPQDALAWAQDGLQSGVFTPEQYRRGAQALQQAAQNPQTFAQWKQQAMQGGVSATEQLKAQALATQQAATLKETARGHDLTFKASRDNNRDTIAAEDRRAGATLTKPFEVTGSDGVPVLVRQDKAGNVTPVPGFQPKGMGATKLTEAQGNATNFAARMKDASVEIDALEKSGVSSSDLRTKAASNELTNWLASPDGQRYRQAQENWVTANLRKESGAAIGKDEMAKDIAKWFPKVGDSKEVREQKAHSRQVAEEGMLVQAGPGAKQVQGILDRSRPANTPAPGVPDDIAAILKKHGGS